MVFIHGGGFHLGTASSYMMNSPENLLDRDVILVTLNYRLNVYGFLNLGTEEAPGNQGLWDQRQGTDCMGTTIDSFQVYFDYDLNFQLSSGFKGTLRPSAAIPRP